MKYIYNTANLSLKKTQRVITPVFNFTQKEISSSVPTDIFRF